MTEATPNSGLGQDSGGKAVTAVEPKRVIIFVAAAGTIPISLIYALEREFPWVVVEQVENVKAACADFAHPVSLVLVDTIHLREAENTAEEIFRQHPLAFGALIQHDTKTPPYTYSEVLSSQFVRSVLPMNLRLDIWLSVVRLILRGGEYIPPDTIHAHSQRTSSQRPPAPNHGAPANGRSAINGNVSDLTGREIQILEMVSQGLQNKSIAVKFGLSEHTVKIHLHNIISKLGAHNRTEAAARFRDHLAENQPGLISNRQFQRG